MVLSEALLETSPSLLWVVKTFGRSELSSDSSRSFMRPWEDTAETVEPRALLGSSGSPRFATNLSAQRLWLEPLKTGLNGLAKSVVRESVCLGGSKFGKVLEDKEADRTDWGRNKGGGELVLGAVLPKSFSCWSVWNEGNPGLNLTLFFH